MSIRIAPGSEHLRALSALVAHPGQTCEQLARHLYPATDAKPTPPWPSRTDTLSQRAAMRRDYAAALADWQAAVMAHEAASSEATAALLHRLTDAGAVRRRAAGAELAPWFHAHLPTLRRLGRNHEAIEDNEGEDEDDEQNDRLVEAELRDETECATYIDMVCALAGGPIPLSRLLGSGSGARWKVYSRAVEEGVIIPPDARWPTERGRAIVAAGGQPPRRRGNG